MWYFTICSEFVQFHTFIFVLQNVHYKTHFNLKYMKNKQETKTLCIPRIPSKMYNQSDWKIKIMKTKKRLHYVLSIKPSRFSFHLIKTFFLRSLLTWPMSTFVIKTTIIEGKSNSVNFDPIGVTSKLSGLWAKLFVIQNIMTFCHQ